MPKTNFCKPKVDRREVELKAVIAAGVARAGISRATLAKKIKVPQSTLCIHVGSPRDMRLGELWDILDALGTDAADRAKIL